MKVPSSLSNLTISLFFACDVATVNLAGPQQRQENILGKKNCLGKALVIQSSRDQTTFEGVKQDFLLHIFKQLLIPRSQTQSSPDIRPGYIEGLLLACTKLMKYQLSNLSFFTPMGPENPLGGLC